MNLNEYIYTWVIIYIRYLVLSHTQPYYLFYYGETLDKILNKYVSTQ